MNAFANLLALILCLVPHGDLHKRIADLNNQIAHQPRSVKLRLNRGELLRLHGEHIKALKDYQVAHEIDPKNPVVSLMKGQLYFDMRRYAAATRELSGFLELRPKNVVALRLMAENAKAQGQPEVAIRFYCRLFQASPATKPNDVLSCARIMAKSKSRGPKEAVRFLDSQIGKLGPIIVFELEALKIEKNAALYPSALKRINRLARESRRPDLWHIRRAEVYRLAKDNKSEFACWRAALKDLHALPKRIQLRPANVKLAIRIKSELTRLSKKNEE